MDMNENLRHDRTKETEVRIANISKENETVSLDDFILTIGVNIGLCSRVQNRGSEEVELQLGTVMGNHSVNMCLKWNHHTSSLSRLLYLFGPLFLRQQAITDPAYNGQGPRGLLYMYRGKVLQVVLRSLWVR